MVSVSKKSIALMVAAAAGLMLSGCACMRPAPEQPYHEDDGKVYKGGMRCQGSNACKGMSDCASSNNSCKGKNSCKGQGWNYMKSVGACRDHGGVPGDVK
jgi:hypothetical protein